MVNKLGNKYKVKSSGEEDKYKTGGLRDKQTGKGRYDLLPPDAIDRLAKMFEAGADRYADRNWEKGVPLSRYLDSALRHTFKTLKGEDDEDHAAAAAWNIMCFMQTKQWIEDGILPAELDNLPKREGLSESMDALKTFNNALIAMWTLLEKAKDREGIKAKIVDVADTFISDRGIMDVIFGEEYEHPEYGAAEDEEHPTAKPEIRLVNSEEKAKWVDKALNAGHPIKFHQGHYKGHEVCTKVECLDTEETLELVWEVIPNDRGK